MRWLEYRPSRKTVVTLLMLLSALSLVFPPKITDAPKHTMQLLAPLQDLVSFLTFNASRSLKQAQDPTIDERTAIEGLRHQIASQAGMIEQLKQEKERLGGIRDKFIPRVLQAQIISRDIAEWRDSILVERGSQLGLRPKDWIASRLFINQGSVNSVEQGQAVIAQEVLLGRVEQVSPFMARVQLFSDIDCPPVEVRIGSLTPAGFEFVEYPCSIRGHGRGQMIIKDVDYRYIGDVPGNEHDPKIRKIRVGDDVCSAPSQLGIPEPMVIGRVVKLQENSKKRLVYDVIVEPAISVDDVRYVHVIPLIQLNPLAAHE